jgi:hypothetical protein
LRIRPWLFPQLQLLAYTFSCGVSSDLCTLLSGKPHAGYRFSQAFDHDAPYDQLAAHMTLALETGWAWQPVVRPELPQHFDTFSFIATHMPLKVGALARRHGW